MSYILDALKKSDRERQDSSGPTLQTLQQPHAGTERVSSRLILQLVIVVLLFLLGLAALWIVNTTAVEPGRSSALDTSAAEPQRHSAVVLEPSSTTLSAGSSLAPSLPPPLVPFWQLPETVQQDIPAMTFSLHIYADNPTRRTIIINKNRMTEGDRVLPGLLLERITEQGVILNWKKTYRFSIDVVEAW